MNRILIALAAAFVALSGFSGDYVVKTWRTSLNADMDRIREVWASGSNSVRDVFKPWLRTCVGTNGQMQVFDEMHTTDLRDRRELRFYRNGELVGKQLYTNRIEVASVATAFKVETNRLAVAVSYSNDLGKVEFRSFTLSRDELLKPHDRDACGESGKGFEEDAEREGCRRAPKCADQEEHEGTGEEERREEGRQGLREVRGHKGRWEVEDRGRYRCRDLRRRHEKDAQAETDSVWRDPERAGVGFVEEGRREEHHRGGFRQRGRERKRERQGKWQGQVVYLTAIFKGKV